ncbi:MAG: OmpA family protein, partial [Alphaproteobacteria bacterium]|nr:OmpA family protein [Alphaproteobacteria bacterium]
GRTICQIEQSKNYTDKYVTGNYVSKHKKLVVRYDNSVGYFAVLEGSNYTPSSKDKFTGKNQQSGVSVVTKSAATPAQPTASITGKVIDEYDEPAIAYVYLQQNNQDLKNSKGNLVVASTSFNDGSFEIPGYTWGQGYSLRINVMSQDMIKNYSDHPDLNTPIIFKLPKNENVNMIDQLDVVNTIKLGNDCQIINSDGTKTAGSIQYAYPNDKSKTNSFACKPNFCEHKTYKATKLTTGTYEYDITQTSFVTGQPETRTEQEKDGHIFECELDTSLDQRGKSCPNIKSFDPNATDGTVTDWDPESGEIKSCTSDRCVKDFEPFPTGKFYKDNAGQTQEYQMCRQTTCPKELWKDYPNAIGKTLEASHWKDGKTDQCKITACDTANGWVLSQKQNKCISNNCNCTQRWDEEIEECVTRDGKETDCNSEIPGAIASHWDCKKNKSFCKLEKCGEDYTTDIEHNICISQINCTAYAKQNIDKNATVASWADDEHKNCVIKACSNLYRVDKSSNTCVIKNDEDIDKLTEARDKARENEKSLQNRINGAIGIGGVGIGGMMIGGALSERAADDAAESDMRAYVNTFRCEYGNGQNVAGGKTNVEIPGGNELIDVYVQYTKLANDLKLRKTSLGIKPGIESEVLIDSATSGLYDDVGTGVVGGGYASIARAIMNPDGPDVAMWAAMRAKTDDKLKTGIGIATAAAALSLAGNIAGNYIKPNDAIQNAQQAIQQLPTPQEPTCATFGFEGDWPNCICEDPEKQEFIAGRDHSECRPCEGNKIVIDGKCQCPANTGWFENAKECKQETCTPQCDLSKDEHLTLENLTDCACNCKDGYTYDTTTQLCYCPKDSQHKEIDGKCTEVTTEVQTVNTTISYQELPDISLSSDSLFDSGKSKIKNADVLRNFAADIASNENIKTCQMDIYGYADTTASNPFNKTLSKNRADAVKYVLEQNLNFKKIVPYVNSSGMGEEACTYCIGDTTPCKQDKTRTMKDNVNYQPCRRVDIKIRCQPIDDKVPIVTTTYSQSLAQ